MKNNPAFITAPARIWREAEAQRIAESRKVQLYGLGVVDSVPERGWPPPADPVRYVHFSTERSWRMTDPVALEALI